MNLRHIFLTVFVLSLFHINIAGKERVDSVYNRGNVIERQGAFLKLLAKRDTALVADRFEYGIVLNGIKDGAVLQFPNYSNGFADSVDVLTPWQIDTLNKKKKSGSWNIEAKVILTSFEAGRHRLPRISVILSDNSNSEKKDTLLFDEKFMEIKAIPIDTTKFKVHDIKGQISYPITFKEISPYLFGCIILAVIILAIIYLLKKFKKNRKYTSVPNEPPHISALRKLDKYRNDKLWVPEKQKLFYSGITDVLREYISARYNFGAMEMTTAEIFSSLKNKNLQKDLYSDLKHLFETADFVKYAKEIVPDEYNAKVLPLAIRFVTDTYRLLIDSEVSAKDAVVNKDQREDDSAYMPK